MERVTALEFSDHLALLNCFLADRTHELGFYFGFGGCLGPRRGLSGFREI